MSDIPSPTPSPAEIAELIPGLESEGPLVGIVMGSESDRPIMEKAAAELDARALSYEMRAISAHRNPKEVADLRRGRGRTRHSGADLRRGHGRSAARRRGRLHRAAGDRRTDRLGRPGGMDALLAISQMPPGVPVGGMAIGGARNAAIFASRILAQGGTPIAYGE